VIAHVVLMNPKPDLAPEDRRAFVDAFERAVRNIPAVRNVRIGTRVVHGAQYENGMPDTGAFLAVIDFDDLSGLQTYLRHPEHDALGRLFYLSLSSAFVYDYEAGGVELLQGLGLPGGS
jgi:hypothetical protein